MRKRYLFITLAVVVLAALASFFWGDVRQIAFAPQDQGIPVGVSGSEETSVQIVAEGLSVPWDVAFLPGQGVLVTERTGTIAVIENGGVSRRVSVPEIASRGEGGLLGMVLHPNFEENRWLYLYETYSGADGTSNRVVRYEFTGNSLANPEVLIDEIPGAAYHDGGRIRFGPDGFLYVTTGDAGVENSAQDINSLAGKILRLRDDGGFPADNPFFRGDHELSREAGYVYSYGHRNPQGLAWDEEGKLWSTEHGRSGLRSGFDELNLIEAGANYGWPLIQGDETRDGMRTPVMHSGSDTTWAPASALFHEGSIFWGGLRGESLYEAEVSGENAEDLKVHFSGEFGRIRTVVAAPDDFIYLTTSNTDGRGNPHSGDDKLVRVHSSVFDK